MPADETPLEDAVVAAEVPDRAIQSALEFAVGIAAASVKQRLPLAFPAGLKPFLRFHKLPPSALATVRAAVESDADFIARLGMVATDELLDEAGMLWLQRPEGWQQQIAQLSATASATAGDDAADVRREQRRREAAEAVALRSRAELAGLREQLDTERAARVAAQAEAERAAAELTALRERLSQTERAVQKRSSAVDAAVGASDTMAGELSALRAELAASTAARDAALADRAAVHGGGPADLERVRALLTEALMLTRPGMPTARRRSRKPIAVPGGVYGNSVAAGEHLLRTADVVVLVDGYNVAKLGWPGLMLEQQRAACIEAAENLARRWGTLLHVVFDGADIVGAAASGRRLVRVSYSPEGVTADDVLRAEVAALDVDRPIVVVTNDQAVIADIRSAGANALSSNTFLDIARR